MRETSNDAVFTLQPVWSPDGSSKFHLVDFRDGLFDAAPLHKAAPLAGTWKTPILVLVAERRPAQAYFCPGNCFFFSRGAREALEPVVGSDVEWLTVQIAGFGEHFALHPLRHIRLAATAKYRTNEVSGNIVEVSMAAFARSEVGNAVLFCAAHPAGSAAGEAGFSVPTIYLRGETAEHFSRVSGVKVAFACAVGA